MEITLQWGRRNYPAETFMGLRLARASSASLQWGRRNYPAETAVSAPVNTAPTCWLQWGRRNYPAETSTCMTLPTKESGASMGPPELPGGNRGWTPVGLEWDVRLQWGRRNYPAETPAPAAATGRPPRRFNGAAGITRRKQQVVVDTSTEVMIASMGPPELPGGNPVWGAEEETMEITLQWGRRNYPAETFMGLRLARASSASLQWGRRNYPAETGTGADVGESSTLLLQWGRRNYPAETASTLAR